MVDPAELLVIKELSESEIIDQSLQQIHKSNKSTEDPI